MRATHYAPIAGLAIILTAGIASSAAQSFSPGPLPSPEVQRRQLELAAKAAAKLLAKSKVTCGLTIVPADPKVDQKAIKPVPDQTVKPTIRQVPPTACRPN
jgi:hypothetical protein